jgi:hypothetical protein
VRTQHVSYNAAEAARLMLKLMDTPAGPTPTRRVSWTPRGPESDEPISISDMRRLSKYARYRRSAKGQARMTRYNHGPAGQQANWREYMKRLQARIDAGPARIAQLQDQLNAAGGE